MKRELVLDIIDAIKQHAPSGYQQDEQDFNSDWLPNCDKIQTLYLTWATTFKENSRTTVRYRATIEIDLFDQTTTLALSDLLSEQEVKAFTSFHKILESRMRRV